MVVALKGLTMTRESDSAFDIQRNLHDWQPLEHLGAGGQSDVYLVREPFRMAEKEMNLAEIRQALAGDHVDAKALATAVASYSRSDTIAELGALKIFKIPAKSSDFPPPPPSYQPLERLKNEIAALRTELPGLPKLLDCDEDERWIITEYFPERSMKHNLPKYRGDAIAALKAFRSLVQTVVALHAKNYVHRDIKPANVFVRGNDLVLGDFGIVYMPRDDGRVTMPLERVGPRDYMPPWTNLGERDDDVRPTTDIYMLGKLLWSLVDGRIFLPYQYQKDPRFDLTVTFQGDPNMQFINRILEDSVVEHEEECILTAADMLGYINKMIQTAERGGQMLRKDVPRPCRICGEGFYVPEFVFSNSMPRIRSGDPVSLTVWIANQQTPLSVFPFVCSYCGHLEFFTKSAPKSKDSC
jgi:serine/threonine protein kinase